MTIGRLLFALCVAFCVVLTRALVASEFLALARDALFIVSLVLVWREADDARLVEAGWLALVAGAVGQASNGTPLSAMMCFIAGFLLLGGYRLRFGAPTRSPAG